MNDAGNMAFQSISASTFPLSFPQLLILYKVPTILPYTAMHHFDPARDHTALASLLGSRRVHLETFEIVKDL